MAPIQETNGNGADIVFANTTTGPAQGWTYDSIANAVVFGLGAIPPAGATIDVSYRF